MRIGATEALGVDAGCRPRLFIGARTDRPSPHCRHGPGCRADGSRAGPASRRGARRDAMTRQSLGSIATKAIDEFASSSLGETVKTSHQTRFISH
jgi:hypothetical protein